MPNQGHPYFDVLNICKEHGATLVVVSKTRPIEKIMEIYGFGQRVFGENRVQELLEKVPLLPGDIQWHLIGHLQTNKVRAVLPYAQLIHSLDRIELWEKLNQEAQRISKTIDCLLEIKIAAEDTKYGWSMDTLLPLLEKESHLSFPNVRITGVMGMASFTDHRQQIREEMRVLRQYFLQLKNSYFKDSTSFNILSMGMSGDYQIALEEGSTMVRIGSLLFP